MTRPGVHIETLGQGPDLVMLHGWGMHSGYFSPVLEALSSSFRLHLVDLPGHGRSGHYPEPYTLENVAGAILTAVKPALKGKAIWLGWSLGGSIATWIAAHARDQIAALILVASNPRFMQQTDWPYGVADALMQTFADELCRDYDKTLLRFLALQIRGADNERAVLRQLREHMRNTTAPPPQVLYGGLEILRQFDGRALLQQLTLPVLMIGGQKDTLVPPAALQASAAASSTTTLSVWPSAGHALFLAQPDRFTQELKTFAHDLIL
ncbi:MAG: pimeloyl-ACP methyl ester esterase BioH [Gammaproteobacteria bacterium]